MLAELIETAGFALITAGVYMLLGLGAALVAAGVFVALLSTQIGSS